MWLEFARWERPFEKMRFPIELVGCLGLHRQAQGALGRALSPVASRSEPSRRPIRTNGGKSCDVLANSLICNGPAEKISMEICGRVHLQDRAEKAYTYQPAHRTSSFNRVHKRQP